MTGFPSPSAEPARLEELYQSVILDHNRRPRNHREMEAADARAEGRNPNCGDKVIVWLRLEGDTVADVSFRVPPGEGCAISRASASIMTTAVRGKSVGEVEALFDRFINLLTVQRAARDQSESPAPASPPDLGSLEVFSGVSRFPHRVKCATMAWHALHSALRDAIRERSQRVTARDFSTRTDLIDAGFERVACVADLHVGALLGVTCASGAAVCLFNAAGRIGAIAGLCTHQAFPMSQGMLQPDGTVQCSWHGAKFDYATGCVREGPAMDPIQVYETRVRDGEIWVGPAR